MPTPELHYKSITVTGEWADTDMRPSRDTMQTLRVELRKQILGAHKHTPGDKWHRVPCEPTILFNRNFGWSVLLDDANGAIFAEATQLCGLLGLDWLALQRQAYPGEEPEPATDADFAQLTRPATVDDAQAILDDLESINYSSLLGVLQEALNLKGLDVHV